MIALLTIGGERGDGGELFLHRPIVHRIVGFGRDRFTGEVEEVAPPSPRKFVSVPRNGLDGVGDKATAVAFQPGSEVGIIEGIAAGAI
jgi:hypothetical protein